MTDQLLALLALQQNAHEASGEARFDDALSAWLAEYSGSGTDAAVGQFMLGLFITLQNPTEFDVGLERLKVMSLHRGECMVEHGFSLDTLTYESEAYVELAAALGISQPRAYEILEECTEYGQQQFRNTAADFFDRHRQTYVEAAWMYINENQAQIPASVGFVE